jgi:hypothetical protein
MPVIHYQSEFVAAGGIMSYGTNGRCILSSFAFPR